MEKINNYIDYTYLKEDCSEEIIDTICTTAINNKFYGVCCPPEFVRHAKDYLSKTQVKVVSVISFPEGTDSLIEKIKQTKILIENDVDEIDMVMNYSELKLGNIQEVKIEILAITSFCHEAGRKLKVIIESGLLTNEEVVTACNICEEANVDYVKTSTGLVQPAAELDKVSLMRKSLSPNIKIKAAGGIRTKNQAEAFIKAGADRIGTSVVL